MNAGCSSCGAALITDATLRAFLCPYCASPHVIERPPTPDAPAPRFILGFSLTHEAAQAQATHWLRNQNLFCDSGVKSARLQDVRGVYVPAWLYSAVARAQYSAEIGEEYTETETYTTTENGRTVVRTRTVTKTEWRPLRGDYVEYVPDVLVTASRGLPNVELEAVEPFDLRILGPYTPAVVSGWVSEEPSLGVDECKRTAEQEIMAGLRRRLEGFMPGDSHRNLTFNASVEDEDLDLVLMPVWILAAQYDAEKPPFRLVINGQTGAVFGKAPLSPIKIGIAVAIAVVLVLIVLWAVSS